MTEMNAVAHRPQATRKEKSNKEIVFEVQIFKPCQVPLHTTPEHHC